MTIFLSIVATAVLGPAAAAGAHSLSPTITLPATQPVEDSGFAIQVSGDVSSLNAGDGYVSARIRPAGGTPCAPTYDTDPGDRLLNSEYVKGTFSNAATYTAGAPGDYLVCAWLQEDDFPRDTGPPASATATVRPAILQISAVAPPTAYVGVPFGVTVNYRSEVPRYLTVLVASAPSCSVSSEALRGIATAVEIADDASVSGTGSTNGTVRIDNPGTYLVCGFLEEQSFGSATAEYVAQAASVVVTRPLPPFKRCGRVGGRRNIRDVRARVVLCPAAVNLARRWGRHTRAPRFVGSYRCSVAHHVVTCTLGTRQVKFTFGRT